MTNWPMFGLGAAQLGLNAFSTFGQRDGGGWSTKNYRDYINDVYYHSKRAGFAPEAALGRGGGYSGGPNPVGIGRRGARFGQNALGLVARYLEDQAEDRRNERESDARERRHKERMELERDRLEAWKNAQQARLTQVGNTGQGTRRAWSPGGDIISVPLPAIQGPFDDPGTGHTVGDVRLSTGGAFKSDPDNDLLSFMADVRETLDMLRSTQPGGFWPRFQRAVSKKKREGEMRYRMAQEDRRRRRGERWY